MTPEKTQPAADSEPVEVVDPSGRLLAIVSAGEAHRQSLAHRAVLVLVYGGPERIVLGKRPKNARAYPGRWELPVRGHRQPGEAAPDAAHRLAEARYPGLGGAYHVRSSQIPASETTGFEDIAVFRCMAHMRPENPDTTLAVNRDELAALVQGYRELLVPELVDAFESGLLFGADIPEKKE